MLSILMIGAGGIGGYYGARLAEAGHRVVLTARGAHLAALQEKGLVVHYQERLIERHLPAVDHAALMRDYQPADFDAIVITLKSTATKAVLNELAPWLAQSDVPVLSLQNGVDNEPMIARVLGESRVLGGLAVRIGGHVVEPGVVEAEGVAQIVMGEWPCIPGNRTPVARFWKSCKTPLNKLAFLLRFQMIFVMSSGANW